MEKKLKRNEFEVLKQKPDIYAVHIRLPRIAKFGDSVGKASDQNYIICACYSESKRDKIHKKFKKDLKNYTKKIYDLDLSKEEFKENYLKESYHTIIVDDNDNIDNLETLFTIINKTKNNNNNKSKINVDEKIYETPVIECNEKVNKSKNLEKIEIGGLMLYKKLYRQQYNGEQIPAKDSDLDYDLKSSFTVLNYEINDQTSKDNFANFIKRNFDIYDKITSGKLNYQGAINYSLKVSNSYVYKYKNLGLCHINIKNPNNNQKENTIISAMAQRITDCLNGNKNHKKKREFINQVLKENPELADSEYFTRNEYGVITGLRNIENEYFKEASQKFIEIRKKEINNGELPGFIGNQINLFNKED